MIFSLFLPFLDILIQTWTNVCSQRMREQMDNEKTTLAMPKAVRKAARATKSARLLRRESRLNVVVGAQLIAVNSKQQQLGVRAELDEEEEEERQR